MSESPEPAERLLELAQRVLDGQPIDWEAELGRDPGHASELKLLAFVADVAQAHRVATRIIEDATLEPPAGGAETAREAAIPGTWGSLRIVGRIGGGEFGQVYRAHDPRLQIDVALKLFRASAPARRDSLLAEARRLARIQHPNVLAVYGADQHDGVVGMWTPLIDGQTLEAILARQGPFSPHEATLIAIDVCRALAAVHALDLVHGDVKPANVMREKGGRVVLMDFGASLPAAPADAFTTPGGAIGTPILLAPEVLRGGPATRQSDLYALGVLLYRLVSGRYPIEASSLDELRQAHEQLKTVPLRDRRADVSQDFVDIVDRALAANPAGRFASAGDMERALLRSLTREASADAAGATAGGDAVARSRPDGRRNAGRVLAVALVAVAAVAVAWLLGTSGAGRGEAPVRFTLQLPQGMRFSGYANAALAPDGRNVVYAAQDSSGVSRLWLRALDALDARALPGSEGAYYPFWSPDSRRVGYFARGTLWTTTLDGGRATALCAARAGRGASWSRDGRILFAPNTEGPLYVVRASGGEAVQATTIDSTSGEIAHRWPAWMPDGQHFIYLVLPPTEGRFRLYASAWNSDRRLALGTVSSAATYASGALVYLDDQTLVARPFDAHRLRFTGEPVAITDAKRFAGSLGEPHACASETGVLAYQNLTSRTETLLWRRLDGAAPARLASGPYFDPRISPDGRTIAVERAESGTSSDVWLLDGSTGSASRLTTSAGANRFPHWSPDGSEIVFASNRSGRYELMLRRVGGGSAESTLSTPPRALLKWPTDWAGREGAIVYSAFDSRSGYDIWLRARDGRCERLLEAHINESGARLDPRGGWFAYESDESGAGEVYCRRLRGGPSYRLSHGGGAGPCWLPDGSGLLYRTSAGAVRRVNLPPSDAPVTRTLFSEPGLTSFDVDPAGRRILCAVESASSVPAQMTVILNWPAWMRTNR